MQTNTETLTYSTFGSGEYQRKYTATHFIILSHIYFEYDVLPVSASAFTCFLKQLLPFPLCLICLLFPAATFSNHQTAIRVNVPFFSFNHTFCLTGGGGSTSYTGRKSGSKACSLFVSRKVTKYQILSGSDDDDDRLTDVIFFLCVAFLFYSYSSRKHFLA